MLSRTSLRALAAVLVAACGSSEALTDPETPGNPADPEVPSNPPDNPPPNTLPLRTDLGTLGGASSYAYDVNDDGVVVGAAQTTGGTFRAFRWTIGAGLQELPPLPGDVEGRAVAVSNDNTVLGISISEGGIVRPVTWTASGTVAELPIPPIAGAALTPQDRNTQGTVIGDALFQTEGDLVHGWVWSPTAGLTDLAGQLEVPFENYAAAVNEEGSVVGTTGGGLWRAYLWRPQSGTRSLGMPGTAPDRTEITALGVNEEGRVVGWTRLLADAEGEAPGLVEPFPTFGSYAYIWSDASGFRLLPVFNPELEGDAVGEDLNDRGDVVGSAFAPSASAIQAAAWTRGGAIVNLNGADVNPSVALAVNNTGIAVGWTSLDGGEGTNRATVWNIDRATPVTASISGRMAPAERPVLAKRPVRGAAKCLHLRTRFVTKAKLAACFEGGGQ